MAELSNRQYAKILLDLTRDLSHEQVDSAVKVFIRFLYENQTLSKADFIIKEYEELVKEEQGVQDVEVVTARSFEKTFDAEIKGVFGGSSNVTAKVDPSMKGGVVLQTKNKVFDGSIKHQLEKLRLELKQVDN